MRYRREHFFAGVCVYMTAGSAGSYAWAQTDIRDIKPPVAFPAPWVAMFIIGLIVLLSGVGWLLYRIYRRRKIRTSAKTMVKSPWETAYERLDALVKRTQGSFNSDLPAKGEWGQYYSTLSDIVRRYFEERFEIRAPEMTSEEFLISLRNFSGLTQESKTLLGEFLVACDMVKFAKHSPDAGQARKDTALARRLIDETKD